MAGRKKYVFQKASREFRCIVDVLDKAGMTRVRRTSPGRGPPPDLDWDFFWGGHLSPFQLKSLRPDQRVNHFPGSWWLGRKDMLWKMLHEYDASSRSIGGWTNPMPETFVLPNDWAVLRRSVSPAGQLSASSQGCQTDTGLKVGSIDDIDDSTMVASSSSSTTTSTSSTGHGEKVTMDPLIVKPIRDSCGRGISVAWSLKDIPSRKSCIAQKYIVDPKLIDGYKFDLRLYVLVASYDPLVAYLYNDGLVRFATVPYSPHPTADLRDRLRHLTNFSLNKRSSTFVANTSAEEDGVGSKWSLEALRRHMQASGDDTTALDASIKTIIVNTLQASQSKIAPFMDRYLGKGSSACFELYGFDVVLDASNTAWLLEVNISPSMHAGSPLDRAIKEGVAKGLLDIVDGKRDDRVGGYKRIC